MLCDGQRGRSHEEHCNRVGKENVKRLGEMPHLKGWFETVVPTLPPRLGPAASTGHSEALQQQLEYGSDQSWSPGQGDSYSTPTLLAFRMSIT